MSTSEKILLPEARLSFPRLFKARAFQDGQTPRYEAVFLLDPSDKRQAKAIEKIEAEAEALISAKWPKKRPSKIEFCFGYADEEGLEYDGYSGQFFIRSNKKEPDGLPVVVDRSNRLLEEKDGVVYAGSYVNGTVTLWLQDNQYGKRINANLRGVQFVRDGEAFSGAERVDPDDEFAVLEDADESDYLD